MKQATPMRIPAAQMPAGYAFDHSKVVRGVGNFSVLEPPRRPQEDLNGASGYDCAIDRSVIARKFSYWDGVLANGTLSLNPDKAGVKDDLARLKAMKALATDKAIAAYHHFKLDGKPLKLRYFQDVLLSDKGKRILFSSSNQLGKEQPYSALILTPEGYQPLGSITIGSVVFGSDGNPCKVLDIFEQGIKPVYEFTFNDGSRAECGMDHLWKVQEPKNRFAAHFRGKHLRDKSAELGKWTVLNTRELLRKYGSNPSPPNRCIIPVTEPVRFPEEHLPIDPYIVGCLLGDGSLTHHYGRELTSADEDLAAEFERRLPNGLLLKKQKSKYHYRITANKKHTWSKLFRQAGLKMASSDKKRIPERYLLSSPEQRLWLLRGLMDTDGTITEHDSVMEFYSKSKTLAEGVLFLVNSLGGKGRITEKKASYKKNGQVIDCGTCNRVRIFLNDTNPFFIKRKAERHYPTRYRKERVLHAIRFVRYEQSRCLLVNSPDSTYLTNECIVTHNSLSLDIDAATEYIRDHGKEWVGILVSKSLLQSQYQMSRIRQLLRSADIDVRVEETEETKTGKKDNSYQATYTFYDTNSVGRAIPRYTNRLICCPPTGSALGYPADVMWLDEFDFWENIDHDHFINQIAKPRTFETNGAIKVFTNPDGKKALWKLWGERDKRTGNAAWHRYQFNYWDHPLASQEGFDDKSQGMSKAQIESTLLSIFSSAGGAVFSSEEIRDMKDAELAQKGDLAGIGKETAWFLDIGSVHDQSVLVGGYLSENKAQPDIPLINAFYLHKYPVGYPLARVVGLPPDDSDGWSDYAEDNPPVKDVLDRYAERNPHPGGGEDVFQPVFAYDATGNPGMRPLFDAAGIAAVDVTFSGRKKWAMYQRFQYYAQQRWIKKNPDRDQNTIDGKDADYQLSRLTIKENTNTTYKQIHHESEEDYDDCPDAIAGLIHTIENPNLPTLQYDIINPATGQSQLNQPEEHASKLGHESTNTQENQYIPSFMNRKELSQWSEQKLAQRR